MSAHAFFLNKSSLLCFPIEPKSKKSFSKFINQLWKLIFSMFSARHIKSDTGFSDTIVTYLNKYIFYFKEYIETELGEYRLDYSKLKEMPRTELILKSKLFLT